MTLPSVLEYARYHGLTFDARSEPALTYTSHELFHVDNHDLHDPPILDCDQLLRDDKLQLSHTAVQLLAECMNPVQQPDWTEALADHNSMVKLRMELPMLISDHERDMKWFKKSLDLRKLVHDQAVRRKLERDSSDVFPGDLARWVQLASVMHAEIEGERLQTTLEVMKYLAACTRDDWTEQYMEKILAEDLKPSQTSSYGRLTPLLTPQVFTEDLEQDLPPIPALTLESQPEIEVDADDLLRQLEQIAKTEDQIRTSVFEGGSLNKVRTVLNEASKTPPFDIAFTSTRPYLSAGSQSGPDRCTAPTELKFETPLVPSPPDSTEKARTKKLITFKDIFQEFVNFPFEEEIVPNSTHKTAEDEDEELQQSHQQYSEHIKKDVMHEKVGINDHTLRTKVPRLQTVEMIRPHRHLPGITTTSELLKHMSFTTIKPMPVNEERLNWIPIPQQLLNMDLKEKTGDTTFPDKFLEKPVKTLHSEQLLYKDLGLRILDFDPDLDEEMDDAPELSENPPSSEPISQVPQKRPAGQIDAQSPRKRVPRNPNLTPQPTEALMQPAQDPPSDHRQSGRAPEQVLHDLCAPLLQEPLYTRANSDELPEPIFKTKQTKIGSGLNHRELGRPSDCFSAADSLTSFLDLKGGRFKKPDLSPSPSKLSDITCHPIGATGTGEDSIFASQSQRILDRVEYNHLARSGSLRHPQDHVEVPCTPIANADKSNNQPLPDLRQLVDQRTIMIDSCLVNNRQLLAFLDRQGKQLLTIVYRELHELPHIILNPKACILYINSQALTQRSLPGQKSRTSQETPQDKIWQLTAGYESIHILVSLSANFTSMVHGQMDVMTDFSAFCASVEVSMPNIRVTPVWIPVHDNVANCSATENPLSRWTWSLLYQHAFRNTGHTGGSKSTSQVSVLIQDETLWELFLRRAGMNPMAAQALLARLKKQEPINSGLIDVDHGCHTSEQEHSWGLGKFVSMSSSERRELFGEVVGAQAIDRINRVLDGSVH